jgi:hypothetical protein
MIDDLWRKLEPLADRADNEVERILTSPAGNELKAILQEAAATLPEGCSVSLDITLNVFDPERGNALPLLTTGLATSGEAEPYVTHGDSSPCRYLVDGDICEVPHDRCPHCWATWDFKIGESATPRETHPCPGCGYELGEEVKLMLDNDKCPHCDQGKMSMQDPTCERCGFTIDPGIVAWG